MIRSKLGLVLLMFAGLTTLTGSFRSQAEEPKAGVKDLAWLAGAWSGEKNGTVTEEHWLAPKGDLMLGMNRTTRARGKSSFEFLRIEMRDGKPTYLAQPQGSPETPFPLKSLKENEVVFENTKNDFPHRILYRLEGKTRLVARIEGTIQGKTRSMEWTWDKQDPK